jgi:tetratricopeptide (TPR) repeat protein
VSVKIFISCVSDEFRVYRDQLCTDLTRPNVEVKVQEDFKDLGGTTVENDDEYIRACDAVVHLVGDMTGYMAKRASTRAILAKYPDISKRFPPLRKLLKRGEAISYTQWEAWLALYHGKPLLIAQADGVVPRGPAYAPTDTSRTAQRAHLERLRMLDHHPGCTFVSADQLTKHVLTSVVLDLLANDQPSHSSPLHQLPAGIADFAGRAEQTERLMEVLTAPGGHVAISAIDGMGGLGKTALAVHVAHRLTARYPDGQIVIDMAGTSAAPLSPAQGLARVIRVFEPLMRLPEDVSELRPIYLHGLRGKRVLLILDNAVDGDQVAPLLPPEACALIITSRRRIAVAGVARVDLDLLAPQEAEGLLQSIAGEGRATAAELSRLAELCGRLPLALRVAGMFLQASPQWSAERFITALADERKRLGRLKLEGSTDLDVAASLALSVGELRRRWPDLADRWHELAVFPASFDTSAAEAVWHQPEDAADDALGVLLSRSLVLYDPAQQRWSLHDLMRDLARGRAAVAMLGAPADLAARLAAARCWHAEYYQIVLEVAEHLYLKGSAEVLSGLDLFDRERRNIETGQAWAAAAPADDPAAARLCLDYLVGANVLHLRQHPRQQIGWLEQAAAAAHEIGDRHDEGTVLGNLGEAYLALGETRRAIEYLEQSLVIAREIDDRRGGGATLTNLGFAYASLGETRRGIEHHEHALVLMRETGDRRGEGTTLNNLGFAYACLGETRRAIEVYEQGLVIARESGNRRGEGIVLGNLGNAYRALGETRRAIEYHEQSLVIAREIGDRYGEGLALDNLGRAYSDLGETRRAIELYEQSLATTREIGNRRGECIALGSLGSAYGDLGDTRRAIEHYEQKLVIAREIGDRHDEGNALGSLGIAYAALGETRHAIELYEHNLVIAREVGNRHGEGIVLGNLGFAYADLGETRRAIELYEQGLVIARESGNRRGEGLALGSLGSAYLDLGEACRAIEYHEQSLVIAQEIGNRCDEGIALGGLGNAYAALGDARSAIEHDEQVVVIMREIGDRRSEGAVLCNLGNAYADLGEMCRAIALLGEGLAILEAVESPHAAYVRATIARLELERGN